MSTKNLPNGYYSAVQQTGYPHQPGRPGKETAAALPYDSRREASPSSLRKSITNLSNVNVQRARRITAVHMYHIDSKILVVVLRRTWRA